MGPSMGNSKKGKKQKRANGKDAIIPIEKEPEPKLAKMNPVDIQRSLHCPVTTPDRERRDEPFSLTELTETEKAVAAILAENSSIHYA